MSVLQFPTPAKWDFVPAHEVGISSSIIADAVERERALDIGQSWIVEAPAGSGKTGLLIQRYLKLLSTVDEPDEVLALTFTIKATAEMQERVLGALREAQSLASENQPAFARLTRSLAEDVLRRDAERGWRLLERPHLLNIRTIDSLCGDIARGTPLLSGGIGSARPVADPEPVYRRAAHAVLMRFGGTDEVLNEAIRTLLLHRDGDLLRCEALLAEMLGTREQWGRLVPLTADELDEETLEQHVLPRLNAALERTVCRGLHELRHALEDEVLDELAALARQLAHAEGYNGDTNPLAHCADMLHAPGCASEDLRYWQAIAHLLLVGGKGWRKSFNTNVVKLAMTKPQKERLLAVIEQIQTDELEALLRFVQLFDGCTYPASQWHVAKALFRLLQQAVVELKLLFAREEICDFSEIALAARTALMQDNGDMETVARLTLRHLLVDEMQDTSSTQYELLKLLTAGWDGRSKTVFLVGDPKQSIYLFRQARVELFQQSMRSGQLGGLQLGALRLLTNFRSGQHLVEECNHVFAQMFPDVDAPDGDVTFHGAVAAQASKPGEVLDWQLTLLPGADDLLEAQRQRRKAARDEADAIAEIVHDWQQRGSERLGRPAAIAVLARARSHVREIVRSLAAVGVPYRATEMEELGEQREVLDVLALTRALLHPGDRVAWLAVLHAPWCGAGLNDLFTLAAGDDTRQKEHALRPYLRERAAALPALIRARVLRTLDVLDGALRHTGVEPLSSRVERTWRSLGGDLCTDALGRENVRSFLEVLDTMEREDEPVSLTNLSRRLAKLYAQPSHAPDAVDIMTIHKAKGLEWDVVIVPGLHRSGVGDGYPLLDWLEVANSSADEPMDVLLAPVPAKGGQAGALSELIHKTRRQRTDAELKRLFYVAATRARTALHLFAWPEATQGGEPMRLHGTLLRAALPAARPYLPRLEENGNTEGMAGEPEMPLALAASAEDGDVSDTLQQRRKRPVLQHLADGFDPIARLQAASPLASRPAPAAGTAFERPTGSFGARGVGNAIHAFVERLTESAAKKHAEGNAVEATVALLEKELAGWLPSIRATLRAESLPPAEVERAAYTVERALKQTLQSAEGRWLLQPYKESTTEAAWRGGTAAEPVRVRFDRSFFAGARPGAAGEDTLWIVDIKTGDHSQTDLDAFLASERRRYEPQLRTYAEVRSHSLPAETPIMLGLYFPLLGKLHWWSYQAGASSQAKSDVPREPANLSPQLQLFG